MDKQQNIQVVILAAGKGTRMLPLTETKPKPMQLVSGRNLIEWKLEALPEETKEVIIVVGYQGDQIEKYFGDEWRGFGAKMRIKYVHQEELNGTAGALWAAKDLLHDRFMVMMGDDLYAREDILKMTKFDLAVCVLQVAQREIGGEMHTNPDGSLRSIQEEKHFLETGLMNTGMYMLDRRIFDYEPVAIGGSSKEFGLPHTLVSLAKVDPVALVHASKWLQVTTPEDLLSAEDFVRDNA